jgi:iron complex outermembrane receptor protein
MRQLKITRSCVLAALALTPATAWAQAGAPSAPGADAQSTAGVSDIIVTAQKRAENMQDVPIAVTAFSGDTLAQRGVSDAQALVRLVPNMALSNSYGQVRITLRGLSFQDLATQGGEARVAYHVDGAYIGMTGDIGGTFYDIDRVEVNRGPQGTLFGRNAIAGTVNLITRDPTEELSGYLNAEVGNYEAVNLDGAISGGLGNGVSARFAFQSRSHSGYEFNVPNNTDVNNQNTQAFRGKLKFDQGGSFKAILSMDYARERDRDGPLFIRGGVPGVPALAEILGGQVSDSNPRHDYTGNLQSTHKKSYGATLDASLDLGNDFSLASLTAYRHSDFTYKYSENSTLALIDTTGGELAKQFSEELRLNKDFDRGHIVVGAYYYNQSYSMTSINPALGSLGGLIGFPVGSYLEEGYAQGFTLGGGVKTRSIALFGQATYDLTDTTSLTVGARYSWETKRKHDEFFDFDLLTPFNPGYTHTGPTVSGKVKYNNFSPRITLEQKIGPNQSIYATYAKGFKAGGYNVGGLADPYFPEKLTDYEVGFKFDLFDRKLRLNGAGFYYDYKDLQVIVAELASNKNINAATAKIYGVEFEMNAVPVDGLELDASASFTKSKFTSFDTFDPTNPALGLLDLSGNRLPFTPKYTLSYGAQYTFNTKIGAITIRGDGQSKSQVYFDQFNSKTNSEGAFTILNASVAWKDIDDRFTVTGYVKNITNELAINGTFMGGGLIGWPLIGRYDPPRTYGVRFGMKF